MKEKYPKVSIVIPSWNSGEKIIKCLKSLTKIDYPNFEIILIDNGSTDGTKEKVKKMFKNIKNLEMIENDINVGCATALNQGFKQSDAKYILKLDDDVFVQEDILKKLVNVMEKDSRVGIVTPKVYYYKKPNHITRLDGVINFFFSTLKITGYREEDKGQFNIEVRINSVSGACVLIRRQALKEINYLDGTYFVYYEDTDLSLRIRKAGWLIMFSPITKAWHDCNTSGGGFTPFRVQNFLRSKMIFMKKNSKLHHKVVFFPFLFLVYTPIKLSSFIIKGKTELIVPYFKGLSSGLKQKVRKEDIKFKRIVRSIEELTNALGETSCRFNTYD